MNDILTYRPETAEDFFITENLTREAFWNVYKPGCDEHLLVRNLRISSCFVRELAYVCEATDPDSGKKLIVGAVYYSKATFADGDAMHVGETLCVGPIGVLPAWQGRGIGQRLLAITLDLARKSGYAGAILYGNPDYYHKSGFVDAADFDLHTPDGSDMSAFMCHPLDRAKLARIRGNYVEDPVFKTDPDELAEYEKLFVPKEKLKLPGQLFGEI